MYAYGSVSRPGVAGPVSDLNRRRNASVHDDWLEVLDTESLDDAIEAARGLLAAVQAYLTKSGLTPAA